MTSNRMRSVITNINMSLYLSRRNAGVVERGGLENRCALTRTEGSNPSFSAYFVGKKSQVAAIKDINLFDPPPNYAKMTI